MWKFQMSKASHIWPNHGFTPYRKNIRTLLREEFKKKKRTQPKHDWWGDHKREDDEWEEDKHDKERWQI